MKNLSLILNGVLIIAVAVLYYLHFSSATQLNSSVAQDSTAATKKTELPEIRSVNGAIAYVNAEELLKKDIYYTEQTKQLQRYADTKSQQLMDKKKKFLDEVETFKQIGQNFTESQIMERQQELGEKQQRIAQEEQDLQDEFAQKEVDLNKEFLKKIDTYLRGLSKEKNYSYVFTYAKGSPATIVFANDSLEITNEVINGLNKAHKEKK